ncbi:cupin domain-containing carboxymuconolactone decarboxylase family protein [Rodentibacter trehalosifermentans]|uniref:Carboxymuconolactone decarboxylase n=1 Tax=Rodentibacter trehalosifermentans TaxID=1908263 RepID=A0A1V3IV06_9PAST|nr:cupin domain-containing protein [Rodentibacter trehalosifermentans]OOF46116.1 carboxymuconolactone decarboxylase [Rodentibacter trehalosifermentans]OOF52182.1 carboxymuconolactone decarboxylase [Rodentibacter trehalosifermentans]
MRKTLLFSTALLGLAMPALAEQAISPYTQHQWIEAPTKHFSGAARFTRLPEIPSSPDGSAIVEFEAGTITDWHSHSHGQYLIVIEGEGRTQQWGKPIQIIKKGDVIWCPPNVKHWHGAGEHSKMSHIVISPNAKENHATWLEKVVLPKTNPEADLQKISQITPLEDKQLAIVPIAFYAARGELTPLKSALEQGLASGLTVSELQEIFAHQYAYAGFPRALNGLITLQTLLKERAEKGIKDEQGNLPTFSHSPDYYTLGTLTLNTLNGRDNSAVLWNVEGIDYALKAHLFGYLFSRDNLSAVNRELVTVSTLAGLETVQNQLRSHFGILQNLGLTETELKRIIAELNKLNPAVADKANEVL